MPALNHVLKYHIYMFFKHLQGWGLNYFPEQPIPKPDHSFRKEIFPNIQSKPPLMQVEAIDSCPFTSYLGEETNTGLTTTSFQVVIERDKVPLQPPLLQTKLPQFPQPLLMICSLDPSPVSLFFSGHAPTPQFLSCSGGLKTEHSTGGAASPVQSTGTSILLLATLFLIQTRMPLAFLATWAHCWLMISRMSTSTPRFFSTEQLSSHSSPRLWCFMGLL